MKQDDHRAEWMRFSRMLSPDSDPRVMQMMGKLRMVSHAVHQRGESSLEAAGLSMAQYRVLLHLMFSEEIEGREGLNPSEISAKQGTNRNTVSSLLRSLESAELVTRALDPDDRRKFNICLTDAGRALVRTHAVEHFQTADEIFSSLTDEELTTLDQLLDKINRC